jgi:hypothetical protein
LVHLSYLTLDTLKLLQTNKGPKHRVYGANIIEKISGYRPDSQIAVMVTDGESEQFSFGVRRAT